MLRPEFRCGLAAAALVMLFAPRAHATTLIQMSLVGVTEGGGAADPGEADLTERWVPVFPTSGTTYERFVYPDPFDLSFSSLFFVPF